MLIASIVVSLVVIVLLWGVLCYNKLVRLRTQKEEGWSGIDVQLKRRHDLVGNLVSSVKGYMAHEKEILEKITETRTNAMAAQGAQQASQAESLLGQTIGRLFAVMENYPALRANENVMHLQTELSDLEDNIQTARRYYNATVRDLNIAVETFPSSIVAKRYGFEKDVFFEIANPEEREVPTVSF